MLERINAHSNVLVMGKSGAGKQPRIDVLVRCYGLKQLSTGDLFRAYLKKFAAIEFEGEVLQFWDAEKQCFLPDDVILARLGYVAQWEDPAGVLLGLKAKYFVESGRFAPDSVTNAMFAAEFVKNGCRGMVLDGYPRTLSQAELLLDLVSEHGTQLDAILLVESEDEGIVKRTVGRRICPECKQVYHLTHKPPLEGRFCKSCGAEVIHRVDDQEQKIRNRLEEFQVKTLPAIDLLKSKGIPVAQVPGNLPVFTEAAVETSVLEALAACR
jgi:adenylate kinase